MNIQLSIIIPIYNCEKYLQQCLESVLNQTFTEYELILVDDGSTDGCGNICDEYSKKDSRIKVIHKDNQGSVLARKTGFEHACGEYVSFLDSDDWIEQSFYYTIFEKIKNVDVYCCGFTSEYENGIKKQEKNSIDSGAYCDDSLKPVLKNCLYNGNFFENGIFPALWCKVIKKRLVESIIFSVNPIIKMGDDAAITYPVLASAKSICIDNSNCMYHYRRLQNSLSTSYDNQFFNRLEILYNHFNTILLDKNIWDYQIKYYFSFLITIGFFSDFNAFIHTKKKPVINISNFEWVKSVFNNVEINKLSPEAGFIKKLLNNPSSTFGIIIKTIIFKLRRKLYK